MAEHTRSKKGRKPKLEFDKDLLKKAIIALFAIALAVAEKEPLLAVALTLLTVILLVVQTLA